MANEILKGIAQDMKEMDSAIAEAKDLVSAMKEAGEDVSALELEIRSLEMRKTKWQRMLTARGLA